MFNKFLALIYTILCIVLGYGCWYFIMWFFTNQSDPLKWTMFVKIMYFLFGMFSSESFRNTELKIEIKRKKDE